MKIDFNNVRRSAIANYNDAVRSLPDDCSNSFRRAMKDLRMDLVAIAATYVPDEPDFACVLDDNLNVEDIDDE